MQTLTEPHTLIRKPQRKRVVRVALAGCGVVGGELVRLLAQSRAEIEARHNLHFELVKVLVRHPARPRPAELPPERLTTDLEEFIATEADVVVEAIGGIEPAVHIARAALSAGRRFVTANKAMVAAHGPQLAELASRYGGRLDFESAVGGGIPVIRSLRDSLSLTGIQSVRGILNGTTNYILTRLAEGQRYADALTEAQAAGFAEANPARDLAGEDAAAKISILAWLIFGVDPATLPVRRRGIVPEPDRLAQDAASVGGVAKLIAECILLPEGVAASVEPVILPPGSELAATSGEDNLVIVESRWNGRIRLAGPGAGGSPTASALLGDMLRSTHPVPTPETPAVPSIPDRRPHQWVLSVRGAGVSESALAHRLGRAGVAARTIHRGSGALTAVTEPCEWAPIDLVVRTLESERWAPVVSRYECADSTPPA